MTAPSEQSCRECGVPLAADQRYCLNCGRRHGEPRLDFRDHLPSRGAAAGADAAADGRAAAPGERAAEPVVAAARDGRPQRDYTPLAAAGGIAVLGLMLLVGVLIGRGDGEQATAPPPQIVRVGGDEGGATGGEGGVASGAGAANKAGAKGGGRSAARNAAGKAPPPEITADDSELEALEGKTGKDYSEAAAKLPDEIATPGSPPPVDDEKPGGGSSGTTIE